MANPEHVDILKKGVNIWNEWVRQKLGNTEDPLHIVSEMIRAELARSILPEHKPFTADLKDADLSGLKLTDAFLIGANLMEADLSGTELYLAHLTKANLDHANLCDTNLTAANLDSASLYQANLQGAILDDANLFRANLSWANLHGATLSNAVINESNLTETNMTDALIWNTTFSNCDLSSTKGLDQAIRRYDKLLLILSENSIDSDWVANEIRWARKQEKQEDRQKLFPLTLINHKRLESWELFDSDTATDLAAEVRSYFIPDFTQWKHHDAYAKVFNKLLRDLKAEE